MHSAHAGILLLIAHGAYLSSSTHAACLRAAAGLPLSGFSVCLHTQPENSCRSKALVLTLRGGGRSEDNSEEEIGATVSDADKMLAKAEQLYRSARAMMRKETEKEKASPASDSWASCLKAVTNFVFTGSAGGATRRAEDTFEEAAELFAAAALQLKLQRDTKKAGRALIRSGDCYAQHADLAFQAPLQYTEAAKILRKNHPAEAIIALDKGADSSIRCPGAFNLQRAGRMRRDQAELHKVAGNSSAALNALHHAVELFESDGAGSAASTCRLQIADILAMKGDYPNAHQAYQTLVDEAFDAPSKATGGMSCNHLRFRAGLCVLADGQPDQLAAVLERWSDSDIAFTGSDAQERLSLLLDAVIKADADAFQTLVRDMGDSAGTDKVVTRLLLKIRDIVSREGEGGLRVAESLRAQDDEDLL
jgi:alpha-soluble NSF attachment protein